MSRTQGLRNMGPPPLISLVSRCSAGGAMMRFGIGAVASGASPWSDAANCLLAFPFVVESPTLVNKFFWTNGASVGGNSEIVLYDAAFAKVGTSTGSVAGSGAGVPQSTAPTGGAFTIPPGLYYAAMAHDATTTGQLVRWSAGTAGNFWQAMGCWRQASITLGSLPATATPGDMTNVGFPLFGIITRTVFDA